MKKSKAERNNKVNVLTLDFSKVEEDKFIEHLLNCRFSDVDKFSIMTTFAFYALYNKMHINALIYYTKLLELEDVKFSNT